MEDKKRASKRPPAAKFALAQPILRPTHDLYIERHNGLWRTCVNGINDINMENVSKLDKPLTHVAQL
jgi:hypothetical protein